MKPGYQNMISRSDSQTVLRQHAEHLTFYRIGYDECWIENMRTVPNDPHGFVTHFQVHWTTYLGWKVYMLHTGCIASIPSEENHELQSFHS